MGVSQDKYLINGWRSTLHKIGFVPSVLFAVLSVVLLMSAAQSSASIEGSVRNQLSGVPLTGVQVVLKNDVGRSISVLTDGNGTFTAGDLAPGRYVVSLSKNGFYSDRTSALESISLKAGENAKNVRLDLMPKSGITGRILDEDYKPIPSATVVALQIQYDRGRRVLRPPGASSGDSGSEWSPGASSSPEGTQSFTDARGGYRLFNLQPGEYYIGVWANHSKSRLGDVTAVQLYPNATSADEAIVVTVLPGIDTTGIDVRWKNHPTYTVRFKILAPPICSKDDQVTVATPTLIFNVIQRTETGISIRVGHRTVEAPISIQGTTRQIGQIGLGNLVSTTTANPFRIIDGDVWISPPLYRGTYDISVSCGVIGITKAVGQLTAQITNQDVDGGALVMRPDVPISGHVSVAPSIAGQVDLKKLLIRYRDLEWRPRNLEAYGDLMFVGLPSDLSILPDGKFTIPYVPAGRYILTFTGLPTNAYVASVRIGARDLRDTGIDSAAEGAAPLEVTLDGPGGAIDGVVRNSSGIPVSHAQVGLIPEQKRRSNFSLFKSASTDIDGRFSLRVSRLANMICSLGSPHRMARI